MEREGGVEGRKVKEIAYILGYNRSRGIGILVRFYFVDRELLLVLLPESEPSLVETLKNDLLILKTITF